MYRLQGMKINGKHIEVIVRQMLRRAPCADRGCGGHHLYSEGAGRARLIPADTGMAFHAVRRRQRLGLDSVPAVLSKSEQAAESQDNT